MDLNADPIKILGATQSIGDKWPAIGGIYYVVLDDHSGGTWTVQILTPLGNWIDTDLTFTDNGVKRFDACPGFFYRINGGTDGASAWISDTQHRGTL